MLTIFNTKHITWVGDNGDISLNYFELILDTASDLPSSVDQFSTENEKYRISQGSLAWDVSTGDIYGMKSDGTWVKQ